VYLIISYNLPKLIMLFFWTCVDTMYTARPYGIHVIFYTGDTCDTNHFHVTSGHQRALVQSDEKRY